MHLETKAIYHLDFLDELKELSNCVAVIHGDSDKGFILTKNDLNEWIGYLQEKNILLVIENVRKKSNKPNRQYCYLKEIVELIKDLPRENFAICYDFAHGAINNENLDEVKKYKDYIKHIHLVDTKLPDDRHWQLYTGDIDIDKCMRVLGEIDYKNIIKIERH